MTITHPTTRTVRVPGPLTGTKIERAVHRVTVAWVCPACGGPRGEPRNGFAMDGSVRIYCDQWDNPCGHIDFYGAVLREAAAA